MKIGDFARLGQVSVRMLRHYDALGLLRPGHVDVRTGYRDYGVDQLAVLHRIVALKHLGLTLDQVGQVLGEGVDAAQLQGMLRLRRSELESEVAAAQERLAEVGRRLRLIEEDAVSVTEFVTKSLPARCLAARTAEVPEERSIAEVVEPLFVGVSRDLSARGLPARTGVALYDMGDSAMQVTAGYDVEPSAFRAAFAGAPLTEPLELIELPAVPAAVCGVHLGAVDGIFQTWQALVAWVEARGAEPSGPGREVYLSAGDADSLPERTTAADQADWVTELQQPIRA